MASWEQRQRRWEHAHENNKNWDFFAIFYDAKDHASDDKKLHETLKNSTNKLTQTFLSPTEHEVNVLHIKINNMIIHSLRSKLKGNIWKIETFKIESLSVCSWTEKMLMWA